MGNPLQHEKSRIDNARLPVDLDMEPRTLAITAEGYIQTQFVDGRGDPIYLEENGGLPVNVQDQHTSASDPYFAQVQGDPIFLLNPGVLHEYTIDLVTGHGFIAGDELVLYESEGNRVFISSAISVGTNTIQLADPLNYDYESPTSICLKYTSELNVDGSTDRQTFSIRPPNNQVDVTRVMFQMVTTNYCELDMFGDIIDGLTRGLVMRKRGANGGETTNYFNMITNAKMALLMYDVNLYEAAKHGVNGLGGRLTYGGQSKHGVTIRLDVGESLEVIIQDDLSDLLGFKMLASLHEVGN